MHSAPRGARDAPRTRAAPQVACASDSQPDSCDASSFDEDEYQEPAWDGRRHGQPVGQPDCWDAIVIL